MKTINLTLLIMSNGMLYPVNTDAIITTKKLPSLTRIRTAIKNYVKKYDSELLRCGECVGVAEQMPTFLSVSGMCMTLNNEFTI